MTVSEGKPAPSATPPADFHYRVFAETANQRPLDGPQQALSPHPTGIPDGTVPPLVGPNLVTMGGFNHPVSGVPDPWLAPAATETTGNNADAYVDLNDAPDGFTPGVDFRADVTSPRSFDRIYDTTLEPVATVDQQKAAIANAVLHRQLAARLLVRLGLQRGRRQRAVEQLRPRRRRGRSDARRSAGQRSRRLAQQRQHVDAGRRHVAAHADVPVDRPRARRTDASPPGANTATGTAAFGPVNFDYHGVRYARQRRRRHRPTDALRAAHHASPARSSLVDRGTCTFAAKALNAQAAGGIGIIVAEQRRRAPRAGRLSGADRRRSPSPCSR